MNLTTGLDLGESLLSRRNRYQFLATFLGELGAQGLLNTWEDFQFVLPFSSEHIDFCSWHRHRLALASDESLADSRFTYQLRGAGGGGIVDRVSVGHW